VPMNPIFLFSMPVVIVTVKGTDAIKRFSLDGYMQNPLKITEITRLHYKIRIQESLYLIINDSMD
jgi:hypothetical protein